VGVIGLFGVFTTKSGERMKKHKYLLISILFISCNISNDSEKDRAFYEKPINDSINIYFIPSNSCNISRQDEILFNEYGIIWMYNRGTKQDSILKKYYDSVIYKKYNLSENEIIENVKRISDSLSQILEINQSYNGSYTYADTFPRCIISKDSLDNAFLYKTDYVKKKTKVILNFIVDKNGCISEVHIRKSKGEILDSIAVSKLIGKKYWEPAWYKNNKVDFYYSNWHFTFMPVIE
jgi:hypothetical protein